MPAPTVQSKVFPDPSIGLLECGRPSGIVTLEALAPYRLPFTRPEGDPQPLPYLDSTENRRAGAPDIQLQVLLSSARMREGGIPDLRLTATSYRHAYWTVAQLVAHHTMNGCNLRPGDLLASGTVSGPTRDARGCLLELTRRGAEPRWRLMR